MFVSQKKKPQVTVQSSLPSNQRAINTNATHTFDEFNWYSCGERDQYVIVCHDRWDLFKHICNHVWFDGKDDHFVAGNYLLVAVVHFKPNSCWSRRRIIWIWGNLASLKILLFMIFMICWGVLTTSKDWLHMIITNQQVMRVCSKFAPCRNIIPFSMLYFLYSFLPFFNANSTGYWHFENKVGIYAFGSIALAHNPRSLSCSKDRTTNFYSVINPNRPKSSNLNKILHTP